MDIDVNADMAQGNGMHQMVIKNRKAQFGTPSASNAAADGLAQSATFRLRAILLLVLAFSLSSSAFALPAFDLGFFASRDKDIHGKERFRAIGPLLESRSGDDGSSFFAARPLYSFTYEPTNKDRSLQDFLWPLASRKVRDGESYWHFLPAFGQDFDDAAARARHRCHIYPLLFTGRDKDDEPYFALFPLGGTIHEFLGRDRVAFALFPLYCRSTVNDVVTHDVLWPIFSRSTGDGVYRFKAFPFYGVSKRANRYERRFVLWPFWTSTRYNFPDNSGYSFILFPLIGRARLRDQDSWTLLPPFFKWGRTPTMMAINCPWPFLQFSSGDVNKAYIWPLWGSRKRHDGKSWFFLWPIVHGERRMITETEELRRFLLVPIISYESQTEKEEDNSVTVKKRYFRIWPLMSYKRSGGSTRFRALALWPGRQDSPMSRNWRPLWTIYSRDRKGALVEDEFLWGLYRHRRNHGKMRKWSLFPLFSWESRVADPELVEWNVLKGLVGYRNKDKDKSFRFLYIRFGVNDAPAEKED